MPCELGIGIVTYNRRNVLSETIDRVRQLTRSPDTAIVVADDGSTDGTAEMLREKGVPMIGGINMGVAWNKNRALYLMSQILGRKTIILLEDDTQPIKLGWELDWVDAVNIWGHVNFAADWMSEYCDAGSGTPSDPFHSVHVTAQCSAFSREALGFGGYFDPRFRNLGYEHVEHTRRLVRIGYGGTGDQIGGVERVRFFLIKSDLVVIPNKSHANSDEVERNLQLARAIMGEQGYRAPWGVDSEMIQFRSEIESALRDGTERFRMTYGSL